MHSDNKLMGLKTIFYLGKRELMGYESTSSSEGINVTSIDHNPVLKDEACTYRFLHGVYPEFQYTY